MTTSTTTKRVDELQVGDVVLSLETTEFARPLAVIRRNDHIVYVDGGGFWPLVQLGHRNCVVTA